MGRQIRFEQRSEKLLGGPTCCLEQDVDGYDPRTCVLDERDGRFGFRDLASARQIAKLLNDGVLLSEIIRAVSEIRKWLPDAGLAAVRLRVGAHSDVQVEQSDGRTDKYGQFVLAVDDAREDRSRGIR